MLHSDNSEAIEEINVKNVVRPSTSQYFENLHRKNSIRTHKIFPLPFHSFIQSNSISRPISEFVSSRRVSTTRENYTKITKKKKCRDETEVS